MSGWALISDDEHLCVGCFESEEAACDFNEKYGVLAVAGGNVVYLTPPEEWQRLTEEEA